MLEHDLELFIIHSFQNRDDYRNLLTLLNTMEEFHYINHSATPEKNVVETGGMISDEELAARLFERIKQSQVVLLIAGEYVATSKWIQFEITSAAKLHKSIIAIVPNGSKRISSYVTAYANQIISWDKQKLSLSLGTQTKALA